MSKTLRDLQAATQYRKFSREQDLDHFLQEKFPEATAEDKIAMKLELAAQGKFALTAQGLATDQAVDYGLATDRARVSPEGAPVGGELAALLRKARLDLSRSYRESEVTDALDAAQLGTMERIAIKHLMSERGCLRRG